MQCITAQIAHTIFREVNANASSIYVPHFLMRNICLEFFMGNVDFGNYAGSFDGPDLTDAKKKKKKKKAIFIY